MLTSSGELLVVLVPGAIFIGSLIGLVGVGGVLLPPLILFATDLPFDIAVRISLGAFFFTGLVGTAGAARSGQPPLTFLGVSMAGAITGVYLSPLVPRGVLLTCLALLALSSGALALIGPIRLGREPTPPASLTPIAFAVGVGSALTGTGGPVLLAPILLFMKVHVRKASHLAQIIQLPIGAVGLASAFETGFETGLAAVMLGGLLAMGAIGARYVGGGVSPARLRHLTGVLLCAFGLLQIAPVIADLLR